jgi:hypothetical protein
MELFKLSRYFFIIALLFAAINFGYAQESINFVRIEKVSATVYKVVYKLNGVKASDYSDITLKIYRRRDGAVQEVFSEPIMPDQVVPNRTYSYTWRTDNKVVQDGDQLQAKIVVAYNKVVEPPPVPNAAPIANAGGNLHLQLPVSLVVIVDGSASKDPDGRIVAINWKQISGPSNLRFASPTALKSYVVGDFKAGVYIFELAVTDDKATTSTARIELTVKAAAPAVVAPPVVAENRPPVQKTPSTVRFEPPKLKGGPSNALLNVLVPGLGHYFVSGDYLGNDRKPQVLLITALYAGSVGGAVYYKLRSNSYHQKYLDLANFREVQLDADGNVIGIRGANKAEANQYLASSKTYQKNFLILTAVSGGIIVADLVYTLIKGLKNKAAWQQDYSAKARPFIFSDGSSFTAGVRINL